MKRFLVFGEPVEILIGADETDGRLTTLTQESPPGGGVPPHSHANEDETFYVLDGEYEFVLNGNRRILKRGEAAYAARGSIHKFRNVGVAPGKLLIVTAPGGFENYLREISSLSIPQEMRRLIEISEGYGITFAV